jgi:hypothetical protein
LHLSRANNFETVIVYSDAPLVCDEGCEFWELSAEMVAHEEIRRQRRTPTFIPRRQLNRAEFASRCGDAWPAMLGDTDCLV